MIEKLRQLSLYKQFPLAFVGETADLNHPVNLLHSALPKFLALYDAVMKDWENYPKECKNAYLAAKALEQE